MLSEPYMLYDRALLGQQGEASTFAAMPLCRIGVAQLELARCSCSLELQMQEDACHSLLAESHGMLPYYARPHPSSNCTLVRAALNTWSGIAP